MLIRKLLPGLTLLILLAATTAHGQDAPAGDGIQTQIKKLKTARAALEAEDLAAAAEALQVPAIEADAVDDWKSAIDLRLIALAGHEHLPRLRRGIPEQADIERRQGMARAGEEKLDSEIAIYGEEYALPEDSPELLSRHESRLAELSAQRKSIQLRLAERGEETAGVERDLPSFEAKLESLRAENGEDPPDASDALGIFRRETVALDLDYRERWVEYAKLLLERGDALRKTLDLEGKLLARREERERNIVERARKRLRESHSRKAAEFARLAGDARKNAKAIDLKGLPEDDPGRGEKADFERDGKIYELKSSTETDRAFLQQLQGIIEDEQAENEDFLESKTWIEKRFKSSRGVSSRTADLLIKALHRVRTTRRSLDRELIPRRENWHNNYLTYQA